VTRWQKARWWTAAVVCVAAAPLPPVATWLLYAAYAPTATRLLLTMLAGVVTAYFLAGGLCAAGNARERPEPPVIRPARLRRPSRQQMRWHGGCVGRHPVGQDLRTVSDPRR